MSEFLDALASFGLIAILIFLVIGGLGLLAQSRRPHTNGRSKLPGA